jgi:hypothetical protein
VLNCIEMLKAFGGMRSQGGGRDDSPEFLATPPSTRPAATSQGEGAAFVRGAFIETGYDTERLPSALGYKPPVELEADLGRSRNRQSKPETALSPNQPCLSKGVQSTILSP